jgi:hypothetical protein
MYAFGSQSKFVSELYIQIEISCIQKSHIHTLSLVGRANLPNCCSRDSYGPVVLHNPCLYPKLTNEHE